MTEVPESPLAREGALLHPGGHPDQLESWVEDGLDPSQSARHWEESMQAARIHQDVLSTEVAPCTCCASLLVLHPALDERR